MKCAIFLYCSFFSLYLFYLDSDPIKHTFICHYSHFFTILNFVLCLALSIWFMLRNFVRTFALISANFAKKKAQTQSKEAPVELLQSVEPLKTATKKRKASTKRQKKEEKPSAAEEVTTNKASMVLNAGGNRRVLCVAEKNDAAKNISRLLSNQRARTENGVSKYNKNYVFDANFQGLSQTFLFTSVSGHLMNYAFHNSHKQWRMDSIRDLFTGQILLEIAHEMRDIETNLKRESRKASMLIIWTDCDREGEYIGNEIVTVCRRENAALQIRRARFSEITEQAVTRALHTLAAVDQHTVAAVDCRMELDLRIGAAFTRLQTLYLQKNFQQFLATNRDDNKTQVVSYGSCQFPTLGFVVQRYKDNKEFVSEQFWRLSGRDDATGAEFVWERDDGLSTQLFQRDAAQALLESCNAHRQEAKVVEVEKRDKSKWRPPPMDTILLEKLGIRHLKMSARRVMEAAEKLYQRGFISYPRTETNCYSPDYNLAGIVGQLSANAEWGQFARQIQRPSARNGRKNDKAHPPIHPVKNAQKHEIQSPDEWKVYELVCRHFLASVSRDATGKETKVKVVVHDERFTATGLIVEDFGYLEVYPYERWTDKQLPNYQRGQQLSKFYVKMTNGFTQPPPLLTEADLISLMDRMGIGTDATHAEHIEKIKNRKYVVLNRTNRFEPTGLGMGLIDGYDRMQHLHSMSKPTLRARLEADLVAICEGRKAKDAVLREQLQIYKDIFLNTERKIRLLGESLTAVQQQPQQRN